jgi:gliding motility-associated-like protein
MKSARPIFFIAIIFLFKTTVQAQQNLVPNPSFELIDHCPEGHMMGGDPWVVQNWHIPPGSVTTPDLFCSCFNGSTAVPPHFDVSVPLNFMGYAFPKTGENYMGFLLKYGTLTGGEYLQTQLLSPLVSGQSYICGFYTQKADSSYFAIDKIGMNISMNANGQSINQPMTYLTPQIANTNGIIHDSTNWINIEGIYTALGGESFITIGNFFNSLQTNFDVITTNTNIHWGARGYYLLDDVYIIPYNENLTVEKPDTICWGESITLTANGAAKYAWYVDDVYYSGDSIITIEVRETQSIKIVGYLTSLEFNIAVENCPTDCGESGNTSNIFTPNGDGINDFLEFNSFPINSLEVFNRWGNTLFQGGVNSRWNGDQAPDGVYFYKVSFDCENDTHTKTAFIQLIR